MSVSDHIKKQIVLEVFALIFLVSVIIYSFIGITKGNGDSVINDNNGIVTVFDNIKDSNLKKLSDGEGLKNDGIVYTVTNNREKNIKYNLVLIPNIKDDKILENIRISVDDLYIEDLISLEKNSLGYIVREKSLGAGFTKKHEVRLWYKLKTSDDIVKKKISFDVRLVEK